MRSACSFHLILFYFITIIKFGEEYKVWSTPLRNFLWTLVVPFLVGLYMPNGLEQW
jgi:hypothetical protein